jgi:hypothetical protein
MLREARRCSVTFVERVAKEGSPAFVPLAERIATVCDQRSVGRDAPPLYLYRVQAGRGLERDQLPRRGVLPGCSH